MGPVYDLLLDRGEIVIGIDAERRRQLCHRSLDAAGGIEPLDQLFALGDRLMHHP
jgi:hypothetical protein